MSNEINTVASVRARLGSEFYPEWDQNYCLPKNEVNTNYFVVSGNYGDNECPKLDDISKREVITYEYYWSVLPTSLNFPGAGATYTLAIDSHKTKYINGVSTGEVTPVGYTTSVSGAGFSMLGKSITASENTSSSGRSGSWHFVQNETGWTADGALNQDAASFTTREDLYAQPSQWQWNYDQSGRTSGKQFEVISKTVRLRNGKEIGSTQQNFSYSVVGDYNAQFYAGKDSSNIVSAWPVMQNNTSTNYYADILLTRSGATDFHIGLYQVKRY